MPSEVLIVKRTASDLYRVGRFRKYILVVTDGGNTKALAAPDA